MIKKNYLYTDLHNHQFIPVFYELTDLYLKHKVITSNELVVYQVLMRFLCRDKTNKHYGFTYITNKGIKEYSGISTPTISKALNKLSDVGLIEIHINPYAQGDFQKHRYTLYEPLQAEDFAITFNISASEDIKVTELKYSQGTDKVEDAPQVKRVKEAPVEVKEEVKEEPKAKAPIKPKKPKKTFADKEVETWNYNDFISFFCYKFKEAYGIEYRPNFKVDHTRLKTCSIKYFNENKVAFMFYIEEVFTKRKQYENQQYPTISIGTICTFVNGFDIPKLLKKAQLATNSEIITPDVKKVDNKVKNMVICNNKENDSIDYLREEDKDTFNELKQLFNI